MPLMNRLLPPNAIITVIVASLAVMAALAAAMPRLLHEQRSQPSNMPAAPASDQVIATRMASPSPQLEPDGHRQSRVKGFTLGYVARLREGYQQIARLPLLRWMALSTFSMTLLMVLLNYAASAVFQAELKTTVAISDFLGTLGGIANLVVLPVQLFLLNRLITRLGLGNASLVFPLVTLSAAGSLAVAPVLATAALGHLDRTALRNAFRLPTDHLLYNAVPQRVKARTRAFVSGLVVPIGAILSGTLLLTPLMGTTWFLPAAMIALGLVFAMAALMVRRHYRQALVDLLEQEDYSSLALQAPLPQEPPTIAVDPATLGQLALKLGQSTSAERTTFLAQLITAVGGPSAVPVVGQAVRSAASSRLRASLLDVLVAADVRTGEAQDLFTELLADQDGQVRLSAISGLEQVYGPGEPRFLELAAGLLADPEIEVRLRILPALLAAEDPTWRATATVELRALLNATDPHTRAQALHAIGYTRSFSFLLELVRSLTDNADEVRLAAGLATETLANNELQAGKRDMLLALALLLLHDPLEPARLAAVRVLDRLSRTSGPAAAAARESLLAGLADPSLEVQQRTVEALVHSGRRVIPQLQEQLNLSDPNLRKMTAVALARIQPHKYASLILTVHLNEALLAIYRNLCCLQAVSACPGPVSAVLARALAERNSAQLGELFYLLSTIRDPAAVETVARSLRSPQPEARANAAEALESLTSPPTAALVAPLFEPDLPPAPLLSLAKKTWDISFPTPVSALRLLLSDARDAWPRTLAAAALAELDSTLKPAADTEVAELLRLAQADQDAGVRCAASLPTAGRTPSGAAAEDKFGLRQPCALSLVERIILLQGVPFFCSMSTLQLKLLASVCEEEQFSQGAQIFTQGETCDAIYILVSGRASIEQEKRKGILTRLATLEAGSCLGESDFFGSHRRTSSAIAIQDTQALRLRREPLFALARQNPGLSLELINVLSAQLRKANERIIELTRTHSREVHKIYDEFM